MSENCKSLVLQDKCNIEILLLPVANIVPWGLTIYKTIFPCNSVNACTRLQNGLFM